MKQNYLLKNTIKKSSFSLDPRTKLFLLVTISTVSVLSGNNFTLTICRYILILIPFVGLIVIKRVRVAVGYLVCLILADTVTVFALPHIHGALNFLLMGICVIFARLLPSIAMGWYFIASTNVSEFISALEKMHVSDKIIIPLAVVFRFFPTIGEEYSSINDAMRMRGIRLGGGKMSNMLEYRVIPLIISCVKIGEELSATALTRGLGGPVKRTNMCNVQLRFMDVVLILLCAFSFIAMLF